MALLPVNLFAQENLHKVISINIVHSVTFSAMFLT